MNPEARLLAGSVYFALAGVAAFLFHRERERSETRGTSLIWAALAGFLVILAFGALTDFGAELVNDVRKAARSEGWYAVRRPLQAQVILAAAVFVTVAYIWSLVRLGKRIRQYGLVMTAIAWLVGFNTVRGISLHQIDAVMGLRVGPVSVGFLGNAVGIGLTVAALLLGYRRVKSATVRTWG